jgi:hypothetical protein
MLALFLLHPASPQQPLNKLTLSGTKALCNDGTPAAMYYGKGDPDRLIVYFQGGFQCWDQASCDKRYSDSVDLMSSKNYPNSITLGGVLDSRANVSKYFHNASKIYLPYCSSDVFAGNFSAFGYQFLGQEIVLAAIARIKLLGYSAVKDLFVAGGSAGGRAAAFNIELFERSFSYSRVRGFFDSPLWLDIKPLYDTWPGSEGLALFMHDNFRFTPLQACLDAVPKPHLCFLTQYQLFYVRQPFFIASSQYDSFISSMFVQAKPPFDFLHDSQSHNIRTLIFATMHLLHMARPTTGVFSLACYTHATSLGEHYWRSRSNAGLSMDDGLTQWAEGGAFFSAEDCNWFSCGQQCNTDAVL